MNRFDAPWLLALLALPLLLGLARLRARPQRGRLLYSRLGWLARAPAGRRVRLAGLPWLLRLAALVAGIVALARPQWGAHYQDVLTEGVDIMIALDVSLSMRAEDFRPQNRLSVAKTVVAQFIGARRHDRLGMVVFAGRAIMLCPLTTDHAILEELVGRVDFGSVPEDGTAIGMALATALNRLRRSDVESRVVVLLTDGVNNSGPIDPLMAADMARALGVRVYAVGVGTRSEPDPLDEETLLAMTTSTGGYYFRATDAGSLSQALGRIDALEKSEIEVREYHRYDERFRPFALAALCLVGLEGLLKASLLRTLP